MVKPQLFLSAVLKRSFTVLIPQFQYLNHETKVKLGYNGHGYTGFQIYRIHWPDGQISLQYGHLNRIPDISNENFVPERFDTCEVYCPGKGRQFESM